MKETNHKREVRRRRIMSYFINAAFDILDLEGLTELSIRKISDKAGYNSATLYNYFSGLQELTLFACIKCLDKYTHSIPLYVSRGKTMREKYILLWECFCNQSFRYPEIYRLLFFSPVGESHLTSTYKRYYEIFPTEKSAMVTEYEDMLMEGDFKKRDYISLKQIFTEENYTISPQDVEELIDINVLIYRGMLARIIDGESSLTVEIATEKAIKYIDHSLRSYRIV